MTEIARTMKNKKQYKGMSVICTEFLVLIFGENWLFFLDSIKTSLYSVLYFILVSDMV